MTAHIYSPHYTQLDIQCVFSTSWLVPCPIATFLELVSHQLRVISMLLVFEFSAEMNQRPQNLWTRLSNKSIKTKTTKSVRGWWRWCTFEHNHTRPKRRKLREAQGHPDDLLKWVLLVCFHCGYNWKQCSEKVENKLVSAGPVIN